MIRELWYRHVVKAAAWRVIASTTTAIIALIATGSLALAGVIASTGLFVKLILYWLHEIAWSKTNFGRKLMENPGCVVWFTGLSGSGKTTVADAVAEKLRERLVPVARLDGDVARKTFSSDLGFSLEDRAENCRRAAIVSSYLKEKHIVLASFISPFKYMREYVKNLCGKDNVIMVYVDCPIEECARRDPKGMYAELVDGKYKGQPFTGMHSDAQYQVPKESETDYELQTDVMLVEQCAEGIIRKLDYMGYL